jgi:hypothetical protein
MPYVPTVWTNREVEKPRTYTLQTNADGTTTLVPAEGTVIAAGTPITADKLNNLEKQYEQAMADVGGLYVPKNNLGAVWGFSDGGQSFNAGYLGFPCRNYVKEIDEDLFSWNDDIRIKVKKAGIYRFDFSCCRSDLGGNQIWELLVCKNDDDTQQHFNKMTMGQYGWNQTAGPNLTSVPFFITKFFRMNVNDYAFFGNTSQDGPRMYTKIQFSIVRIGD